MPLLALVGAAVAVVGPGLLVGTCMAVGPGLLVGVAVLFVLFVLVGVAVVPPPPASGRTRLMQTTWQRAVFFASSALVVTSTWPESDGVRVSSSDVAGGHASSPRTCGSDARERTRQITVSGETMLTIFLNLGLASNVQYAISPRSGGDDRTTCFIYVLPSLPSAQRFVMTSVDSIYTLLARIRDMS